MTSALGLALLAAIEPLGVVAFIAVLGTRGGLRNTRGFIIGWLLCAAVVAVVTVLVSGRSRAGDVSAAISSAGLLQIGLGVTAWAYLVVRRLRHAAPTRDSSDEAVEKQDNLGPRGAALIAAAVQGWPVLAGAVAAVLKATHDTVGRLLGIAAVVLVSASTFTVAHVLAGRQPERTAARLGALRRWIEEHRNRLIDIVLLAVGGYLIVHGLLVQLAK